MHPGQLPIDERIATAAIRSSFPALAELPVRPLRTAATVNALFRVGDRLVARFPLQGASAAELHDEAGALDELAQSIPFASPSVEGVGTATEAFPSAWSIQTWLDGTTAGSSDPALAEDIAALIIALRAAPLRGRAFDGRGRGGTLTDHDDWVAECLGRSDHLVDVAAAGRAWDAWRTLPAPPTEVMSHRDLTPPNLLVAETAQGPRLTGVLDGGGFGPADPSLDAVIAWHLFEQADRRILREALSSDDREWHRAAAWALQQSLGLVWYYEETNPPMSALGRRTIARILADEDLRS
ncbi:aminoglycoside phosphotransferase (APT) family kinase protein [Microbacterium resistens]|uniref:Aminoglycoside phosphotransferase (APT) family kinase protein n=1 Tax=Microbacterium resistens TaxID=156977 RepID=A0ABU1S7D6_9MICO|nr:phosphotransferase [Microbacterium resistens]MDR6865534.1 aminoglycoside phosphotransferase (APT) family kinase protein [Microbacterium resistens]